jgi:hypothetical protein
LSSFLGIDKIIYLDNNKMNTNDRWLKLRDKVPWQKDANSVKYLLLS